MDTVFPECLTAPIRLWMEFIQKKGREILL